MSLPKYNFQGLNISIFNELELNKFIEDVLLKNSTIVAYGYSIGIIPKIKAFPSLLEVSNNFELLVTDGRLFYLYLKFFGAPLVYDISIPNLVLKSLSIAEKKHARVFFLGGSADANTKALYNVKLKYPNISEVNGYHGFWSDKKIVIDLISSIAPDIIYIALPTPEKEILASEFKLLSLGRIIIPCGGMIDVLAGDKKITPRILKKIGLAWFYRFIQEPSVRYKLLVQSLWSLLILTKIIIRDKLFFKKNDAYLKYIKS
ncbi:MAG: WecB/TagA/CpsF family glycosyltransferase [Ignavibacteriaceae bacterium]|jgi:N-acetylglucosaminyldiphosphoundecaprenol N-acetyl-beta-D-mannosaminyltransferase|nr:WecB/TagA/CpsF family glycosyltransferase [Ignavibacteriaceae bacterium]